MRLSVLVGTCLMLASVNADPIGSGIAGVTSMVEGAVGGMTALGASLGKLASAFPTLPAFHFIPKFMLPITTAKFFLPGLIVAKKLAILKAAKIGIAAPIVVPIGLTLGAANLKFKAVKYGIKTVGKTASDLVELPLKATAVKMGAIAGAFTGAKAGLAGYNAHPKNDILKPLTVPAATLISEIGNRLPTIPMKEFTFNFNNAAPLVPVTPVIPETEIEAPSYGAKPRPTPAPA